MAMLWLYYGYAMAMALAMLGILEIVHTPEPLEAEQKQLHLAAVWISRA